MDRLRPLLFLLTCLAAGWLPAAQCELQTLTGPAGGPLGFGRHVAQDGDRLVVASDTSVRVYVREGLTSYLEQELTLPGHVPGAFRVQDVALSGNTLAVAASTPERVHLFERRLGAWQQVEEVWPLFDELQFGQSIALDASTGGTARLAVVAQMRTPAPSPYVVVIFEDLGRWRRVVRLAPPAGAGERFGAAVDLDGPRLAVGVRGSSSAPEPGLAYVFERNPAGWERQELVSARLALDGFGWELDLRGDRLVIGGPSPTPGELARVFDFDGATWRETGALVAPNTVSGTGAAGSVEVVLAEDGLVLAGCWWDDERARDAGAVHVFEESAGAWSRRAKLHSPAPASNEGFGVSMSCDGDLALLGSLNDGVARTYSPRASACRTLSSSPAEISLSAGGRQTLRLNPGRALAGHTFWLLGSASGFDPGFRLLGVRVPLVPDGYFRMSLPGQRTAPFVNNVGVLRAPSPQAEVTIDVPPGTSPALAGLTLYHSFVVFDGGAVVHASNVRTLKLVP